MGRRKAQKGVSWKGFIHRQFQESAPLQPEVGEVTLPKRCPAEKLKLPCQVLVQKLPVSSPQHSQQQRPGAAVTAGSWGSVPRAAGKPQGARGCEALSKKQKFSKRRQRSPQQEPRAVSEDYMWSFAAPLRPQGSEQGGGFASCHGMRSEHCPWRPLREKHTAPGAAPAPAGCSPCKQGSWGPQG